MKIRDILNKIEDVAPLGYQESYDNAGIQVGNANIEATSALICLDCTEAVIDEAIGKGCNLVLSHHPVIFGGLKSIVGRTDQERVLIKAIKHDIVIYTAHTNLDNVSTGVNAEIAKQIGLTSTQILSPKRDSLLKLVVFVPRINGEEVRSVMCEAGAGEIGEYSNCSFNTEGIGTFLPGDGTVPAVGEIGNLHEEQETRIEVVVPKPVLGKVLEKMRHSHPYEEVAYDLYPLANAIPNIGSGMIGELENPMDELEFLESLKRTFNSGAIRYTELKGSKVSKVAVCGGSGSFLLSAAIAAGADVFVTGDFKYHQFFEAEGKIVIADIGHYESEQFTDRVFARILTENFSTFAFHFTETITNPIKYL